MLIHRGTPSLESLYHVYTTTRSDSFYRLIGLNSRIDVANNLLGRFGNQEVGWKAFQVVDPCFAANRVEVAIGDIFLFPLPLQLQDILSTGITFRFCHPEPQRRIARSRRPSDPSLPGALWACDDKHSMAV
ncbi:MAG: hypothetical protein M3R61_14285, partial [Chloroflexota bacterium]|nr:hypothetical protein [Chloroflexota bacterium]